MAARSITSITQNKVEQFLKTASLNDTLSCDKISGFELVKNPKGASYRLRYTAPNRKRRRIVIGKVAELKPNQAAQAALELKNETDPLDKVKEQRQAHVAAQIVSAQRTLGNYLDGLYSKHQARKRSGHETLNMIRKNFAHLLDRDMASIKTADIKNWQLQREQEVAFSTIQRAYGALKTLLYKAIEDGVLEANPLPTKSPLERPHYEEVDKQLNSQNKRRLLTAAELTQLFNGIEAYNAELKRQRAHSIQRGRTYLEPLADKRFAHWSIPFTYLAYYTGMRTGDIRSLTWQNLNLNFRRLSFTPSKTSHHHNAINVTLDLPDSIIELMSAWYRQQNKPPLTGLVFPSDVTDKPLDKKAHITHWEKIRNLAGLPDDLDFYSLRHHWISTLLQTENLLQVARMAGHKSIEMIEKHYGHLIPDRAKGALQAFDVVTSSYEKKGVTK
ncbi:tyrosine-type recombinase/integrase [Thiomicrospira microaerophila]|uniref:tyrosine-type recombinase/integrase n=1 Tax=Thiomicrospira microaerophila TaxID=406020 RepID=UPI00200DD0B2|nr:tyrosine-type recombinase/integrase [Thiomicrospira microaerophila]UQB42898.1 tyrosine-type recombinase/integrase [Thiomicrospira microaerophila]